MIDAALAADQWVTITYEVPQRIHPHFCYRGSGEACAGCAADLEASTPRDLARAWSVNFVS
jgi:hypothetical protein